MRRQNTRALIVWAISRPRVRVYGSSPAVPGTCTTMPGSTAEEGVLEREGPEGRPSTWCRVKEMGRLLELTTKSCSVKASSKSTIRSGHSTFPLAVPDDTRRWCPTAVEVWRRSSMSAQSTLGASHLACGPQADRYLSFHTSMSAWARGPYMISRVSGGKCLSRFRAATFVLIP